MSAIVADYNAQASSEPLSDADLAEADFYTAFTSCVDIGFNKDDIRKCALVFAVVSSVSGADISVNLCMHMLMMLRWYRDNSGS